MRDLSCAARDNQLRVRSSRPLVALDLVAHARALPQKEKVNSLVARTSWQKRTKLSLGTAWRFDALRSLETPSTAPSTGLVANQIHEIISAVNAARLEMGCTEGKLRAMIRAPDGSRRPRESETDLETRWRGGCWGDRDRLLRVVLAAGEGDRGGRRGGSVEVVWHPSRKELRGGEARSTREGRSS